MPLMKPAMPGAMGGGLASPMKSMGAPVGGTAMPHIGARPMGTGLGGGLGHGLAKPPIAMRPHLADGGFSLSSSPPFYERNEARDLAQDQYHPGGLIQGGAGGRTDRLPLAVAADSFVMPADVISGMGQGDTMAGAKIMDGILSSGPFGTPLPRSRRAAGGNAPPNMPLSHVLVAGGEYLVTPDKLKIIGHRMRAGKKSRARSDLAAGHEWARNFVDEARKHQKRFLASAPKPKK